MTSCPAGSHGDNPCPADSSYYQKCVCDANMTQTCTKPYYGVGPSCDGKYASCEKDTPRACKEDGYGQSGACPDLQTPNKKCPYDSAYYDKCVCRSDLVTCTYPQSGVGEACGGKYASCQCPGSYKSCECGGAAGATSCTVNGQTTYSSCKECCTPLASESGCKYGTTTAPDNCGGTRTVCKDCTPTCANAPRWCQSSTYELVETGKDQCGNVCRQCCTEYTDVRTDAFCFLAVDNDIQIKHCGGYSAVNNGGWMAALPTKRTYKDGTVKEIKSCLAGSYTEEMCNFHLKKYPIGETNSEKNCRGY